MDKEKRQKMIGVLKMVATDAEEDATEFDGKPFNGRTVAEYFGNHGAAIKALAEIMKEFLQEEERK